MHQSSEKILLNDVLRLDDLANTKIRFNLMFDGNWNPIELFENNEEKTLLDGQYWNYSKRKSFVEGQTTVGFIKISSSTDEWLLFHIGRVTKDLNVQNGVGYEFETIAKYNKYCGRLVVRFKNKSQNMVRKAESVINECEVVKLLDGTFNNDTFPGYDRVNISWSTLKRVLTKDSWQTALKNQKGIYLIVDKSNGRMYVGSAYGDTMVFGRWKSYANNGHGGNAELRKLSFEHIKSNFRYTLLDVFKSSTDDQIIINRESWWKSVLQSRKYGYNGN